MLESKLGIGPLSTEIIEAVFRYSHSHGRELMLIATKNQIDYSGGYVNGWTTKEFRDFTELIRRRYSNSNVKLCRDHCGPGYNGRYDLDGVYRTIEDDVANGFDLIHIDFCHFRGSAKEKLEASKEAIGYCLKLDPGIALEVGDDGHSNSHTDLNSPRQVEEEINFFRSFCDPEFYVIQTGSLVKGGRQAGLFNKGLVEEIAGFTRGKGIKLKEHNADFLSREEILKRRDLVDAMNIAPQLGTMQTRLVLDKCFQYGVDCNSFLNIVNGGNNWRKWVDGDNATDRILSAQVAGHYHYTSDEYKKIIDSLSRHEDIHESIVGAVVEVIGHYGSHQ